MPKENFCNKCRLNFASRNEYNQHMIINHLNGLMINTCDGKNIMFSRFDFGKFKCPTCFETCHDMNQVLEHLFCEINSDNLTNISEINENQPNQNFKKTKIQATETYVSKLKNTLKIENGVNLKAENRIINSNLSSEIAEISVPDNITYNSHGDDVNGTFLNCAEPIKSCNFSPPETLSENYQFLVMDNFENFEFIHENADNESALIDESIDTVSKNDNSFINLGERIIHASSTRRGRGYAFTHQENIDLCRGVNTYKFGNWIRILNDQNLSFIGGLNYRTSGMLRSRWRNMVNNLKNDEYFYIPDYKYECRPIGDPLSHSIKTLTAYNAKKILIEQREKNSPENVNTDLQDNSNQNQNFNTDVNDNSKPNDKIFFLRPTEIINSFCQLNFSDRYEIVYNLISTIPGEYEISWSSLIAKAPSSLRNNDSWNSLKDDLLREGLIEINSARKVRRLF